MASNKKQIDELEKYRIDINECIELYLQGHYKKAKECFDKKSKDKTKISTDSRWDFFYGLVELGLGINQNAIEYFDNVLRYEEKVIQDLALDTSRSEEEIKEKMSTKKDFYAEVLYNKGLATNKLGKHQDAIECLDTSIGINPNSPAAMNEKGLALANSGRPGPAIEWYDKALECYDKLSTIDKKEWAGWYDRLDTLYNKGLALSHLSRWQDAYDIFIEAYDHRQNDVHLLRLLGAMLANQGLSDDAIKWYDKALELDPKNVDVMLEKGLCLYNLAKFPAAVEWFDKVLAITGNNSDVINYKRWALDKLDKNRKK